MLAEITHKGEIFTVNLGEPIDISMPLKASKDAASAWYVDPLIIEPVQTDQFTGSVALGGSVNFNNIFLTRMDMVPTPNVLVISAKNFTVLTMR